MSFWNWAQEINNRWSTLLSMLYVQSTYLGFVNDVAAGDPPWTCSVGLPRSFWQISYLYFQPFFIKDTLRLEIPVICSFWQIETCSWRVSGYLTDHTVLTYLVGSLKKWRLNIWSFDSLFKKKTHFLKYCCVRMIQPSSLWWFYICFVKHNSKIVLT